MVYPNMQGPQAMQQQQMPPNTQPAQMQSEAVEPKKSKWWLWLIIILVILALGAGAYWYFFMKV
ncbi:hypothetical protein A3K62_01105 [Candidatus Pacearchaeota archaeon RBG_16_35_8]|nr:MAG: hypothetical protein A3K62_01105 [Candidatus Pacearchaeota archaeon RBG_16_35_8]